jgi:hypothetical protein
MLYTSFVALRVCLIALWLYVVIRFPSTHGGHLLSLLAGMSLLSLFSDDKMKKWFVMPEAPRTMKVPPIDPTCKGLITHVGSEEEFKEHFCDPLEEERILMAAVLHTGTGQIWAVEQPGRHNHVCWTMDMMHVPGHFMSTQGFLTSYGRYVDRKEAALIAVSANQLLDMQNHPTRLFSEDVWATPPWRNEDVISSNSAAGLREPAVGQSDEVWGLEELHQRKSAESVGVVQRSAANVDCGERSRAG